jgi:hypothetical protein
LLKLKNKAKMKKGKCKLFLGVSVTLLSSMIYAQQSVKILVFKQSSQIFEQNDRTWETAMADLDSDGDLDVVFTSLGSGTRILFNDGNGYFKASGQKLPEGTHGIAIGDIDNDGDKDLFFALLGSNRTGPVYVNDGYGVFTAFNPGLSIESSERVQLIDIENDGDLDAFLWWRNLLYVNDGSGNFSKSSLTLPENPSFSDMNGDSFVDIICLEDGKGIKVYLNDKKGKFFEYSFLKKTEISFCYTGFADIDNDGDTDVIFSNGNDRQQYPSGVLMNDGTGRLADSRQKLSTVKYGYIGTGDLNNDGFTDIIITDRENPPTIWMNNGKGILVDSGIRLGEGGQWNNCIIEDIDNDGDMDIFVTKVFKGSHRLWFNQLHKD